MNFLKLIKSRFFGRLKKKQFKGLFYVNGPDVLPPPLTSEEESALLEHIDDDENARPMLVEHNLRLVVYIAKRFENNKIDMQDLVSVGSVGLIKAVDSYKLDKNIKLATYASRCIENEILMFLRKANKSINDLSLDDSLINDEEGSSLSLGEMIPDDKLVDEEVELKDQKAFLLQLIEKLAKREKIIMYMRYGLNGYDELTQKEVADIMNISQSYISRLEKKILAKLKQEITTQCM